MTTDNCACFFTVYSVQLLHWINKLLFNGINGCLCMFFFVFLFLLPALRQPCIDNALVHTRQSENDTVSCSETRLKIYRTSCKGNMHFNRIIKKCH